MVDEKSLEKSVGEINQALGGKFKIGLVNYDELVFLGKNARFFEAEKYKNLVDNIKADGQLSSVPFCHKKEGKYTILSGNHRVQAGHDAGIEKFLVLYTEEELAKSKAVAIQLSHNALVGKDDVKILRELFEEMAKIEDKYYSGLDDKTLELMEKSSLQALREINIAFIFLPEEHEKFKETIEAAAKDCNTKEIYLAQKATYDVLMRSIEDVKDSYHIKNMATALMIIMDIFMRNRGQLVEGWETIVGEGNEKRKVPICSILGDDRVNEGTAARIRKKLDDLKSTGKPVEGITEFFDAILI